MTRRECELGSHLRPSKREITCGMIPNAVCLGLSRSSASRCHPKTKKRTPSPRVGRRRRGECRQRIDRIRIAAGARPTRQARRGHRHPLDPACGRGAGVHPCDIRTKLNRKQLHHRQPRLQQSLQRVHPTRGLSSRRVGIVLFQNREHMRVVRALTAPTRSSAETERFFPLFRCFRPALDGPICTMRQRSRRAASDDAEWERRLPSDCPQQATAHQRLPSSRPRLTDCRTRSVRHRVGESLG